MWGVQNGAGSAICQHPLERPSCVRTPKPGFNQKPARPGGSKYNFLNRQPQFDVRFLPRTHRPAAPFHQNRWRISGKQTAQRCPGRSDAYMIIFTEDLQLACCE